MVLMDNALVSYEKIRFRCERSDGSVLATLS